MANVLVVKIGATNYGPASGIVAGEGAVQSVEVRPAQHGGIGTAYIKLRRTSGGAYSIISRMEVKVALVNDATNAASALYFHGFVARDTRWRQIGTTLWECEIDCNDVNILLDWCRISPTQAAINSSAETTFGSQLLRIYRAALLNSAFGVPDIAIDAAFISHYAVTVGSFSGLKGSLREMTQHRCNALNAGSPSVYPKFYLEHNLSATPGVYATIPHLAEYDGAAATLASAPVVAHFSETAPAGGTKTIMDLRRTKDGIDLQTRVAVTGLSTNLGEVTYGALSDSSIRTTYPNPYDDRDISGTVTNAWEGPPIRTPDGLTLAQIQQYAVQALADLENPRETIEITTADTSAPTIEPGDVIQVTDSLEGLSGTRYRVQDVSYSWWRQANGTLLLFQTITAGNKLRMMDDDVRQGTSRVVEVDIVGPDAPTNFQIVTVQAGRDDFQAPDYHRRFVSLSWTPSASSDAVRQQIIVRPTGSPIAVEVALIEDNTTSAWVIELARGQSGTIAIRAQDGSRNWGAWAEIAYTAGAPDPTPTLLYGDFAVAKFDDPTKPEGWTIVQSGAVTATRTTAAAEGIDGIAGLYVLKVDLGLSGDVTITSDPVKVTNPAGVLAIQKIATMAAQGIYRSTISNATVQLTIRYKDKGGAATGSQTILSTPTPTTGANVLASLTSGNLPPSGTVYAHLEWHIAYTSATGTIYLGGCELESALPGTKVSGIGFDLQTAVTLQNGSLTIEDAAQMNLSPETNPFEFYEDDNTTLAGHLGYNGTTLALTALLGSRTLELNGGAGIIQVKEAGIFFKTDNPGVAVYRFEDASSVVLANAALATGATDGFTYLPSMAGAPSGTPTTRTGTIPVVIDTTNARAYFYQGGAWKYTPLGTSGVSAATYDLATITVDAFGRITAASDRAGTSYPGSPANNDWFYRTDNRTLFYWDSSFSKWLSVHSEHIPFVPYQMGPLYVAGSNYIPYVWSPAFQSGTKRRVTVFSTTCVVWTTNDGSNYWKIHLQLLDSTGGGATMHTLSTAAESPDVEIKVLTGNPTAPEIAAVDKKVYIELEPVGTPGDIELWGVGVMMKCSN